MCNAVYVRLNYTQPLCACPSRYKEPCSASLNTDDLHTTELSTDPTGKVSQNKCWDHFGIWDYYYSLTMYKSRQFKLLDYIIIIYLFRLVDTDEVLVLLGTSIAENYATGKKIIILQLEQ